MTKLASIAQNLGLKVKSFLILPDGKTVAICQGATLVYKVGRPTRLKRH